MFGMGTGVAPPLWSPRNSTRVRASDAKASNDNTWFDFKVVVGLICEDHAENRLFSSVHSHSLNRAVSPYLCKREIAVKPIDLLVPVS